MQYHLINFDFDGTLVQTTQAILESIKLSYQHLKQVVPSDTAIEKAIKQGKPTKAMLRLLSPRSDEGLINQLFEAHTRIYLKQGTEKTMLFPHAREIIIALKKAGLAISIVSNKATPEIKAALSHFMLRQYVDLVIGADPDGLCKPDPKIYEKLLKPHFPTMQREHMLMVGDTSTDLQFAQGIQVDACWVQYGEGNAADCMTYKPRYSVQSLKELHAILLN